MDDKWKLYKQMKANFPTSLALFDKWAMRSCLMPLIVTGLWHSGFTGKHSVIADTEDTRLTIMSILMPDIAEASHAVLS